MNTQGQLPAPLRQPAPAPGQSQVTPVTGSGGPTVWKAEDQQGGADRGPDVMAISLSSRLPEFWTDQPHVWFIPIEAILAPQLLGDDSPCCCEIAQGSNNATGKFNALKDKMLSMFEDTRNRQIEKLMGQIELGDLKPSQLLRKMRDLARDSFPDETLRILWQGWLPTAVRAVLVVADTTDLDKLTQIADNVAEATRRSYVSEVAQPACSHQPHVNAVTTASMELYFQHF